MSDRAGRRRLILAFAIVYVVWGSTYLFMRFTVETVPPLGMSGFRFLVAGALLYGLARWRARGSWDRVEWQPHAVAGILLTTGNASISWAVQRVPSGVVSLFVAMTPSWMVLLDWWRPNGRRPPLGVMAGVLLGLLGTLMLIGPGSLGGQRIDPIGAGVSLVGTVLWATGSIYSRSAPRLSSGFHSSAIQMMTGGVFVLVLGLVIGEFSGFHLAAISSKSWLSLLYLVIVGSLIGFSAYMYVLSTTTPALAATYAFVNPVVAILLGALFAGEALSARIELAGVLIVGAVVLITLYATRGAVSADIARVPVREAP